MEIKFLGIGSAWNVSYDNTSAYMKYNRNMLLIDCGESVAKKIIINNLLDDVDELYILISHTHSDHIGSIGTLLLYSKYNKGISNNIVLPYDNLFYSNLYKYLRLVDVNEEVQYTSPEILKEKFNFLKFNILEASHVKNLPCYCFVFEDNDSIIYYSADNSNINYIKHYLQYSNSKIYTEICDNQDMKDEHLTIQALEEITTISERKRIYLMHINESLKIEDLIEKGFNIPDVESVKIKLLNK